MKKVVTQQKIINLVFNGKNQINVRLITHYKIKKNSQQKK